MTKIFLKCPNCKTISERSVDGLVTGNRIQEFFKNSSNYCPECLKAGVGKILLTVVKFDWEKEAQPLNKSNVPTKVESDLEEIAQNLKREMELRKSDNNKSS